MTGSMKRGIVVGVVVGIGVVVLCVWLFLQRIPGVFGDVGGSWCAGGGGGGCGDCDTYRGSAG